MSPVRVFFLLKVELAFGEDPAYEGAACKSRSRTASRPVFRSDVADA